MKYTVFIPNGDSREDTAVMLVGTAKEYGIDQHSIKVANGGFMITDELADVLYEEDVLEPEEPVEPQKTSGNRAAKKNSKEENA